MTGLVNKKIQTVIKKIMKKMLILFLMLATSFGRCQDANVLTQEEYESIKVNEVQLNELRSTFGDEGEIEQLFGQSISKEIDPDGNYFDFGGFDIGFSAIISDGTNDHPIIGGFDITKNNFKMTIKNITFTIGDNINVLGENIVFNTKRDGSKSIVFSPMEGWNNFIVIDFDQETKLITAIYYIELT